ncbi:Hsp70 family protein [Glycomyces tenuis]|uniref:Hsp70 family protein n=1 Tax=Glycomyces tenuis TaxID=58116 RepID=UPI0003F57C49|nr:Hsp70 family protein [Glycomyces tenuis]
MPLPPTRLAVDLGTTHTVAVVARGSQRPRSLLFDGSPLLPSGVFLDTAGTLHAGRDAQRLAATEPDRFEPHPKRRVDDGHVLLGEQEIPVEDLLATVLRRVAEEAEGSGIRPTEVVLTHPADWGPVRRSLLERAAAAAGLGPVRMLAEPIAAAAYCTRELEQEVPEGGSVAVFDFGGGTFDVAVVQCDAPGRPGWRTLAVGGLDDLGGLDVDNLLVTHLGRIVAERDSERWRRIDRPSSAADRRLRQAFWSEVRAAKEMLSRSSTAPVAVPGEDAIHLHLTRDELTGLADPLIARAVDETRRTLERSGAEPSVLLLVGGASRMPNVATRLHARLGIAPSVPEQPELPVAYGALLYEEPDEPEPEAAADPLGPIEYAPYPVPDRDDGPPTRLDLPPTPPAAEPSPPPAEADTPPAESTAPPAEQAAESVSPPAAEPPKAAEPDGAAEPSEPPTASPGTRPTTPPTTPPAEPSPPVVAPSFQPPRTRTLALLSWALTVALIATIVIVYRVNDWGGLDGLTEGLGVGDAAGGQTGADEAELRLVYERALTGDGVAAVTATEEMVLVAEVGSQETVVTALSAAGGEQAWTGTYELEPTALHLTAVGEYLVVDAEESATDEGQYMRAVVSLADGELLWKQPWENRRDVAYYGGELVVEQREAFEENAVIRIDLATGDEVWSESGPYDLFSSDDERIRAETLWDDGEAEEGTGLVPPDSWSLYDNLTAGTRLVDLVPDEGTGSVRDADSGEAAGSGELPFTPSVWTAFEGLAIGRLSDDASPGRAVLAARSLDDFGQAWELPLDAGNDIAHVKPCGPRLVCAAIQHDNDNERYRTIAVDIDSGLEAWSRSVDWAFEENWYTAPDGMVYGEQVFETVDTTRLLDFTGGLIAGEEDDEMDLSLQTRAVRGGLAVSHITEYDEETIYCLYATDIATGERTALYRLGTEVPEQVALAGTTVAVLNADRTVLVLDASALR